MASQSVAISGSNVPDFDYAVRTSACQRSLVIVEAHDAVRMSLECSDALTRSPIPAFVKRRSACVTNLISKTHHSHFQSPVHASSDQHYLVELQSSDGARMTLKHSDYFALVQIPNSNSSVIRSGNENWIGWSRQVLVELQTHDAVCMTLTTFVLSVDFAHDGAEQLTFSVRSVYLPFLQFLSTIKRSQ